MGRPRKRLRPGDYATVEHMAGEGFNETAIYRAIGIGSHHTWKKLKETDERLQEALRAGLAVDEQYHVGKLRAAADKGNVVASIFTLKAKHGWRENEPPAEPSRVNLIFNLPAPMKPEEYRKAVTVDAEVEKPKELVRG